MTMIQIKALDNGAHINQTFHGILPEGWAVIPDDMECENFPFGEVEVSEVDDVLTVIGWIPNEMPEVETISEEPTQLDRIEAQLTYTAMMTDTLLEV